MRPSFVKTPWIYRFFNRDHLVCSMPTSEKVVWLTFDDGPHPEVTQKVLDFLGEREVKATFFVLGANVAAHPEVFDRILLEGHKAGNHTWHHLHGWKNPPGAYVGDIMRCEELFKTDIFRPPYGKFTPSQYFLLRKQYLFVMWSLLTHDFNPRITPEQCLDLALKNTVPGSIVVFHDSEKAAENMLYVLPRYLDALLEQGYSFSMKYPVRSM